GRACRTTSSPASHHESSTKYAASIAWCMTYPPSHPQRSSGNKLMVEFKDLRILGFKDLEQRRARVQASCALAPASKIATAARRQILKFATPQILKSSMHEILRFSNPEILRFEDFANV